MTRLPEAFTNINKVNITLFHEELIPSCAESALYDNYACEYVRLLIDQLPTELAEILDEFLYGLGRCTASTRYACAAAFEGKHPALFRRLYGDLLTHFYSTPKAAERVRVLTDSAPREPSPHFDPTLLSAVIQHQRGKRRF